MKKILQHSLITLSAFGIAGLVHAQPTMTIYEGGNLIATVTDNLAGDSNPATGVISYIHSDALWSFQIDTAQTKPAVGTAGSPEMDISVSANSTGTNALSIWFSDVGFTTPTGPLTANNSGHLTTGTGATESYQVWADNGNNLNTLGQNLANFAPVPLALTNIISGTVSLPSTYSLTEVLTISPVAATGVSVNAGFTIPEPAVSTIAIAGLALFGAARRKQSKG